MPARRFSKHVQLMPPEDFQLALFEVEARYGDLAKMFLQDRRTGHRWLENGPANPVAVLLQLMMSLGLTKADVETIIAEGLKAAGGGTLPKQVRQLTAMKGPPRRDLRSKSSTPTPSDSPAPVG